MLKYSCKYDFSDIDRFMKEAKSNVKAAMVQAGENAIVNAAERCVATGVNTHAMLSNEYVVNEDDLTLTLTNNCGYADTLEANGKDVLSGAALMAHQELQNQFA